MLPMEHIDRAVTDGGADGFLKVVCRNGGTVLGATVVGQRAAEALQTWTLAQDHGLKMGDIARTMSAYPSLATGNQQVAWDAHLDGLTGGVIGRVLRWLAR